MNKAEVIEILDSPTKSRAKKQRLNDDIADDATTWMGGLISGDNTPSETIDTVNPSSPPSVPKEEPKLEASCISLTEETDSPAATQSFLLPAAKLAMHMGDPQIDLLSLLQTPATTQISSPTPRKRVLSPRSEFNHRSFTTPGGVYVSVAPPLSFGGSQYDSLPAVRLGLGPVGATLVMFHATMVWSSRQLQNLFGQYGRVVLMRYGRQLGLEPGVAVVSYNSVVSARDALMYLQDVTIAGPTDATAYTCSNSTLHLHSLCGDTGKMSLAECVVNTFASCPGGDPRVLVLPSCPSTPLRRASLQKVLHGDLLSAPGCNIFACHLPVEWSDHHLVEVFGPFGRLVSCAKGRNANNRLADYAHAAFETKDAAQLAIQTLNGREFNGGKIVVRERKQVDPILQHNYIRILKAARAVKEVLTTTARGSGGGGGGTGLISTKPL